MTACYLGIGSNVEAERNIRSGLRALRDAFGPLELSPVYRSRAVGFDGDDFLNLVARIDTALSPHALKERLAAIEDAHGRRRNVPKFSDRTLDVDILSWGELEGERDGLVLPRPEIYRFAHVLKPFADLAPGLVLPGQSRTLAELWQDFSATSTTTLERVDLDPS
ncbi:MAG: 2-amino-4-hydroxy-6-hydroxymethyldihydropteridine diphosphokinase [Xanthomonadales bacterium]|nr:2-amino-4-hydroxy-6-hydroxymethyldihydropteridine diphosphokinase [Xanthomonadales bacterium]